MTHSPRRRAVQPDPLNPEQRRLNMSRIRGRDTTPELTLRKALYARGCRYRLNVKDLPGTPDLVFQKRRVVIFVNGCFWHGHDCPRGVIPGTNTEFWEKKIQGTQSRDQVAEAMLRLAGWRVLRVWECALRGRAKLDLGDVIDEVVEWFEKTESLHDISGKW